MLPAPPSARDLLSFIVSMAVLALVTTLLLRYGPTPDVLPFTTAVVGVVLGYWLPRNGSSPDAGAKNGALPIGTPDLTTAAPVRHGSAHTRRSSDT